MNNNMQPMSGVATLQNLMDLYNSSTVSAESNNTSNKRDGVPVEIPQTSVNANSAVATDIKSKSKSKSEQPLDSTTSKPVIQTTPVTIPPVKQPSAAVTESKSSVNTKSVAVAENTKKSNLSESVGKAPNMLDPAVIKMAANQLQKENTDLLDLCEDPDTLSLCNQMIAIKVFQDNHKPKVSKNKPSVGILGGWFKFLKSFKIPQLSTKYTFEEGWPTDAVTWVDAPVNKPVILTKEELFIFISSEDIGYKLGAMCRTESGPIEEDCVCKFNIRWAEYLKGTKKLPTLAMAFTLPNAESATKCPEGIFTSSDLNDLTLKPEYAEKYKDYLLKQPLKRKLPESPASVKQKKIAQDRIIKVAALKTALGAMYATAAAKA